MSYYYTKTLNKPFSEARQYVEEHLKTFGFGIVSEIDMHDKFKQKLGVDFRRYKILGACSPEHAYKAVNKEPHIGLMLPCNVVIQEHGEKEVEVSVVDPVASMEAIQNPALADIATEIQQKLRAFCESL
jgi:uncharacterized protein (DUF302 family)